jgi:hypothetical protein
MSSFVKLCYGPSLFAASPGAKGPPRNLRRTHQFPGKTGNRLCQGLPRSDVPPSIPFVASNAQKRAKTRSSPGSDIPPSTPLGLSTVATPSARDYFATVPRGRPRPAPGRLMRRRCPNALLDVPKGNCVRDRQRVTYPCQPPSFFTSACSDASEGAEEYAPGQPLPFTLRLAPSATQAVRLISFDCLISAGRYALQIRPTRHPPRRRRVRPHLRGPDPDGRQRRPLLVGMVAMGGMFPPCPQTVFRGCSVHSSR